MTHGALVVGLGRIGLGYDLDLDPARYVLSHCRAFDEHPAFALLGGVDPDAERRGLLTARYGVPGFPDLATALDALEPEVVAIAMPTAQHAATIGALLDIRPPRAILCEKPLAADAPSAQGIVAACAASDVALYVNYIRRADPGAIEVRDRLRDGRIAGPVKGVAFYSKGLRHNGSHFVNLLEFWFGPIRASSVVAPGRGLLDGDAEPDVALDFDAGRVLMAAAREEAFSHYSVELVASNGRLRYDRGGETITWEPAVPDAIYGGHATLSTSCEAVPSAMDRYQWHVAEQLARALAHEPSSVCTGAQALQTFEAIHSLLNARAH